MSDCLGMRIVGQGRKKMKGAWDKETFWGVMDMFIILTAVMVSQVIHMSKLIVKQDVQFICQLYLNKAV